MKERMIVSSCPQCGHTFQIKRDTLVLAGDPKSDERLEQGTYFMHQCSNCKHLYYLGQPFMYYDPKRKFILLLSQQDEFGTLPKDNEIIRCKNVEQFIFCFRVLSRSLNISFVLQKKKQLEEKMHTSVSFIDYENDCLWFQNENEPIGIKVSREEVMQRKK